MILFDGTLAAGVLGQAVSNFLASGGGACTLHNTVWWVTDLDLRMRTDPPVAGFPWEYGTAAPAFSEYDFESVALHELGHLHGLGHRIAAGQCMHFAISNGASARVLNVNEINGGAARMAYSSVPTCLNPAGSGTPMVLLNSSSCLLPVMLLHFTGEHRPDEGNLLRWTTVQEVSNHGFEIQRSQDGLHFEPVAFVSGSGDTQQFTDYSWLDENPGSYPVWYYRLVQIDLNGDKKASEVVELFNTQTTFPVNVFPTVTQNSIWVKSPETAVGKKLTYSLTSLEGKMLLSGEINESENEISLAELAASVYFLRISNEEGRTFLTRIVRQD